MSNTHDVLRRRFADACSERDIIADKITPLRKRRDEILAKAQAASAKAGPLTHEIKAMEAPLYELHNEIAAISRALSGRTAAE